MGTRFRLGFVAVAVTILAARYAWQDSVHGSTPQEPPARAMALTFNDLPYALRDLDEPATLTRAQTATTELLRAIAAHGAPVVAFANEGRLGSGGDRAPGVALLEEWVDAGAFLGNHTFSHTDFNLLTVDEFRDEIVRGETIAQQLMQSREPYQLYFRHPEAHTGDTREKKEAIEEFLRERGYKIAPHTIDSSDTVFDTPYVAAIDGNDEATAQRIRTAYLDFVVEATVFAERMAVEVFGRDIPQTLLLHANRINADSVDELLSRLGERGYQFVTLDRAMNDATYQTRDTVVTPFGPTWLSRWRRSLGLAVSFQEDPQPPGWVVDLFDASGR